MLNVKKVAVALFVCAGISIFAADTAARMDISKSKDKVKLKLVKKPAKGIAYNPTWRGKDKDFSIFAQTQPLKTDAWQDFEVAFIPEIDGVIIVSLAGPYHKAKGAKKITELWVCWDDVTIDGANVVNGSFEAMDKKGGMKGWRVNKKNIVTGKDGNKYVKVWHNARAAQKIRVKKGQKVTIKAKVKRMTTEK